MLKKKGVSNDFNFALVNRYKDGKDYIGYHRDSDNDLVPQSPIAMVSLGATRDFLFKHYSRQQRKKGDDTKFDDDAITEVKIEVVSGSLLVINHPTNVFWYHSLPKRLKIIVFLHEKIIFNQNFFKKRYTNSVVFKCILVFYKYLQFFQKF
ncbi:hypothetical protein RFI_01908 [Reticulomyxa filosa]|uniref:Fe2OG dioxygenase domain-containing protein n=1 Tax=Reticulomyxa filosa TaxID=46433 RepID=X6PAK4_RETFI|nr:hypothetical protein RFI_01908 [Reticulomyxa filosa]|eukprot:ETO35163.1 hypothetical protein RFI_01908 [Reticulomyxa filosa]